MDVTQLIDLKGFIAKRYGRLSLIFVVALGVSNAPFKQLKFLG